MTPTSVPHVSPTDDPDSITQTLRESGVLIIKGLLSRDQLQELNYELDKPLEAIQSGSKHKVDKIQDFHGSNTKRLTNVTTHSKIFRHQVLENELVHAVAERVFHQESGTYWMGAAQVIQIGPGNKAQVLHRDQGQYPTFNFWARRHRRQSCRRVNAPWDKRSQYPHALICTSVGIYKEQ